MKYPVQISVILPCYNSGKYISYAIESILQQTMQDFEFIIINDGSTDDTHDQISNFSDPRIKYLMLKNNRGNYHARNLGMRNSSGKYICVMDSDDIAFPERLHIQYKFLEKNKNIGAIGAQAFWMTENGETSDKISTTPVCPAALLRVLFLKNNRIIHPTFFVRSHLLKKNNLTYNENYHVAADYDFLARCLTHFPVQNINVPVIKYRIHKSQISVDQYNQQTDNADTIRLSLLNKISKDINNNDIILFQKIMKGILFSGEEELLELTACFNNILELNFTSKAYRQNQLYKFFNYLLFEMDEKIKTINRDPN